MVLLPAIMLASCARMEPPPGGPPDFTAPTLISTTPDSMMDLPGFDDDVEFQFDEVISEGSTPSQGLGTSDLERLILLSPTISVPEVQWKRDRLVVRPREGWQPGRVYRVELLPGIRDLSRNRMDSGTVVTFTTGAPLPKSVLTGSVVDWVAAAPARGALVEAVLEPDSLVYRALADSAGNFRIGPLPAGRYVVYGVVDQNNNRERDFPESFDSATVLLDTTAVANLFAFPHDSVGPRATSVQRTDSMTITVTMSAPLEPSQRFTPASARVLRLPDSASVPIVSVRLSTVDDSIVAAERPVPPSLPDSLLPEEDTAAVPVTPDSIPPAPARPRLTTQIVIRLGVPLQPGTSYRVELTDISNANGAAADAGIGLQVPEPPPPPPPDSTVTPAPPDSIPSDTLPQERQ